MAKVPDDITLAQLCQEAAQTLARVGMEHRIDIYREVEIDDPAVRMMLGRTHRVRVRVKITAASLLFQEGPASDGEATLSADTGPGSEAAALAKQAQRA